MIVQFYRPPAGRSVRKQGQPCRKTRWVIPGSRLSTPKAFGGCHPIELPRYKAAPLQALGMAGHAVHYKRDEEFLQKGCSLSYPLTVPSLVFGFGFRNGFSVLFCSSGVKHWRSSASISWTVLVLVWI